MSDTESPWQKVVSEEGEINGERAAHGEIKFPIECGPPSAGIISEMVSAAVFITLIELLWKFATYTFLPSGLIDKPSGLIPTVIVVKTVSTAIFITLTVLSSQFVTYNLLPSGVIAK